MDVGMYRRGLRSGLQTTWVLGKVIVPVTLVVTVVKHTPVIHWLVGLFAPLMNWFGLPGEAAVVLGLGFILNLYAAIGAMFVLPLEVHEIFILSVMLSFSHNLLVETAVAKRAGLSAWVIASLRIGTAFLAAAILRFLSPAGLENTVPDTGYVAFDPYFWNMSPAGFLLELLDKAWSAVWQLGVIVIPLMFIIQILKEIHFLDRMASWMRPVTHFLGLPEKASIPLLAGIFFGLAYGAGVILQATEEEHFSRRDLYLMFMFLILCHAVVEDTLLFVPLGVNPWLLLGTRLGAAIVLTVVLARVWRVRTVKPGIAA